MQTLCTLMKQSPHGNGKCSSLPKAIKNMRNMVLAGAGCMGWLCPIALPAGPVLSSPAVTHPSPPSIPLSSLPVTFPNTSCGATLSRCSVPGRMRSGCQGHPVPGEEEESLSPAPAPKAHREQARSHPRTDPGAAGPGAGTAPLPAGFKGEGRGKESPQRPSPGFSWQHDAPRATAGRGCDAGSWERWPGSCRDPAQGSNKLLPKGPPFLSRPPPPAASTPP